MRTIARNHTRKIATVRASVVKTVVKDLGANFEPAEVGIDAAFAAWQNPNAHGARLYDNEDGTYTIHIHSNKWFKLYTQDALDRIAAMGAVTAVVDGPSTSDLDRLRALNLADRVAPVWKVANNGAGERIWFVLRRTPGGQVPAEYREDVNGNIIRYTLRGALDVAERLNAAATAAPVAGPLLRWDGTGDVYAVADRHAVLYGRSAVRLVCVEAAPIGDVDRKLWVGTEQVADRHLLSRHFTALCRHRFVLGDSCPGCVADAVCRCVGQVACAWVERDGKPVSTCLRCGSDR